MSKKLTAVAASNGVGIAPAYLLVDPDLSFDEKGKNTDPFKEKERFEKAVAASVIEIEKIKAKATETLGSAEAAVFDAHIALISDMELKNIAEAAIDEGDSAEVAVKKATDNFIATFEAMTDNPYMQERAADVRDIAKRLFAQLLGITLPNPALIDREVVVVAHDLTPSDTAQLNPQLVKGIVTDLGGRTAHAAIMARTLEIPAVVGTVSATADIKNQVSLIVDGTNGIVEIDVDQSEIDQAKIEQQKYQDLKAQAAQLKDQPTVTADGVNLLTAANIGSPKDMQAALDNGAEGVGLFRTEFLFIESDHLPTEDEQFEAYKSVLEKAGKDTVTVRTMDIGGDKFIPYMPQTKEDNPFLGYRALRRSLAEPDIFRTQLRALIRSSVFGNLWIMFPMVATLDEFRQAKAIYDEEFAKLKSEGAKVSDDIKLGIMVEIPAAAVLADQFAKEVDFFSIGTNDLIAYTMAADRGNDKVAYLYQPYNPSILRLVKNVIDAAHKEGKVVAMCGEMAGDSIAVPILIGMGLDEYSMSSTSILMTRALMKTLDSKKMQSLAEQAINLATNEEVIDLVNKTLK